MSFYDSGEYPAYSEGVRHGPYADTTLGGQLLEHTQAYREAYDSGRICREDYMALKMGLMPLLKELEYEVLLEFCDRAEGSPPPTDEQVHLAEVIQVDFIVPRPRRERSRRAL